MWLSYLQIDETAARLGYDLAVDASGHNAPSPLAAGFPVGLRDAIKHSHSGWTLFWLSVTALAALVGARGVRRGIPQA
jgi:hypothetical protein